MLRLQAVTENTSREEREELVKKMNEADDKNKIGKFINEKNELFIGEVVQSSPQNSAYKQGQVNWYK